MKIIVRGNYDATPWLGAWSCSRCKSAWEVEASDPKPAFHQATNQRDDSYYQMNCPVCGEKCNKYAK